MKHSENCRKCLRNITVIEPDDPGNHNHTYGSHWCCRPRYLCIGSAKKGGKKTTVTKGSKKTTVKKGGKKTTVKKGGKKTTVKKGGKKTTVKKGGKKTTVKKRGKKK